IDAVDNEDEARASVAIRPGRHMHRWMDEMLYAVDGNRCLRALHIQDAFYAQHPVAVTVQQHRQPEPEQRPVERSVEAEREGMYGVVMAAVGMRATGVAGGHLRGEPALRRRAATGGRKQISVRTPPAPHPASPPP